MISWKHSFKRLNEEYEIAKKKKHALDNLFENGRISQATRDSFDSDINAVIMEIEKQQKALLTKMQGKATELESQIKTLETLLANYEIQHVVGEIDEEMYQREMTVLSTGLESARNELNIIKEATSQLCPPVETPTTESALPVEENEVEAVQSETVENVSDAPAEVEAPTEPYSQEPDVAMEEAAPEAPSIESVYVTPEETQQIVEEAPEVIENQPEITEELPQNTEDTPQETEWQPQFTEDTSQDIDEAPETVEDNVEITEEMAQPEEEMPQTSEELSQETEYQPEIIQETLQSMDETPEMTEEATEVTEESSQNVEELEDNVEITEEMAQPEEEMPQTIENEPQIVEETLETVEETSEVAQPVEEPEEAPQEISVEAIAEEEQEAEEAVASVETEEDTETQEL